MRWVGVEGDSLGTLGALTSLSCSLGPLCPRTDGSKGGPSAQLEVWEWGGSSSARGNVSAALSPAWHRALLQPWATSRTGS